MVDQRNTKRARTTTLSHFKITVCQFSASRSQDWLCAIVADLQANQEFSNLK
jgi:hypothetical protein